MWRGDEQPFHGRHYDLERPLNSPQSLSRPHPRIVIAGSGEQKTLRLVARYADACNLFPTPEIPHKLEVLRGHCDTEGRDYAAIEKSSMYRFDLGENGEAVDEAIGGLRWLASMGIEKVHASVTNVYDIKPLEIIAERILPIAAEL
jgi:alkanesulfonate monooxygenase SsuD/methylene tetrahydromethanopterin reductase-like flavin-dependent oxidoreductase (luciferase family)